MNICTIKYENGMLRISGEQSLPDILNNNSISGFLLTKDSETYIRKQTGSPLYKLLTKPYVISEVYTDGLALLNCAIVLGMTGKVTYSSLERNLYTKESDMIIDVYESKYASPEVIIEYSKPYGSDIELGNAIIKHGVIRKDERVFGLKYARPGIYHSGNLIYMDFKNFYPNLVDEMGCPPNFSCEKWSKLIQHHECKFAMNKIIGRFDSDYSLFYNPTYANNLRKFGRMKLMYYISKCKKLILCNTDSILAEIDEDFEYPSGVTIMPLTHCLIKNIGNYILYSEYNGSKTTGIFNKDEELIIGLERMGIEQPDENYSVRNLFGIDIDGYISSNSDPIPNLDRKCRYGLSRRLLKQSLISIQENI